MKKNASHLIIGCGYLGGYLLNLLADRMVWVTYRTALSSKADSILLDINNTDTWDNLSVLSDQHKLTIYFMVPPSGIDMACFVAFVNRLNQLDPYRSILISSTVVYGNRDRVVNADSNVAIDSARAERQFQIEQAWLNNMNNACIVRLAGIYGPDRVIGLKGVMKGETINGDPEGWLNLIHVDDAASLVKRIGEMDKPERIELGCDGIPIKRKAYYAWLAEFLDKPLPDFHISEQSRGTGRRCDNKLTIQRTGWQPEHKAFRQALAKLIST